jgi:VWFA-related protein
VTATRRPLTVAVALTTTAVWLNAQGGSPPAPPQTFRSSTDLVTVDVSVRRGNTPVTGLTAADFDLRDSGVRQKIESVEVAAVPIDLSIVVDVSGDPRRPWKMPPPIEQMAASVEKDARELTRLLREGDRVRLLALDTYVQPLWSLQPAATLTPLRHLEFNGHASLYNTLATLLLQPAELTRRHVIVLNSIGRDTISAINAVGVRAIAEQSDAQMHLVMREVEADIEITLLELQCGLMQICAPTARFWRAAPRRLFSAISIKADAPRVLTPDGLELRAAARATGGGWYQGVGISEPTLLNTFEKAFEDFRQSYILRYRPEGVRREGWHPLTVSVPRDKSLRIRARPGYGVDDAPAATTAPPAAPVTPSTELATLDEFASAYGQGAYTAVALSLRRVADPSRLIADFDRGDNPWPASPRREAMFALELAEAGMFSDHPVARRRATELLERFGGLIRHPLWPDDFERAWLLAQIAMLQATLRPSDTMPFVERALARFPDEPRFLLARAIVADQHWPFFNDVAVTPIKRATMTPEHVATVTAHFEAAAVFPSTRAEAAVRFGWFLHRLGRSEEAVAKIAEAAGVERVDRDVAYLRDLLLGHVLTSLDRTDQALTAYRRALSLVPGAQSARVATMNTLLLQGNRSEAEAMAEALQSAPGTVFDPWWLYWQGDYRHHPQAMAAARRMIQ